MPRRVFESAKTEFNGEPLVFEVGGEEFTVPTPIPGIAVLSLASENAAEAFMAYGQFFRTVLAQGDYPRFVKATASARIELEELIEVSNWIIGEGTGRPTEQRPDSGTSQSSDGTTSAVAATSQG